MPEKTLRILEGNRITLPKEFREKWKLKEGGMVVSQWNDEPVLVITAMNLQSKVTIVVQKGETP